MSMQPLNPTPVGPTAPMAAQAKMDRPPPKGLEIGMESLKRLEPDLTPLPMDYMVMSIAVSLKGINDNLFTIKNEIEAGNFGQRDSLKAITDAITSMRSAALMAVISVAKAKREAIQNELSKMPC